MSDLGRLARAVAHLTPAQVAHRVRLRAQKQLYQQLPEPVLARRFRRPSAHHDWPAGFTPIDRTCPPEPTTAAQLESRTFHLVGETATLPPGDWSPPQTSQLWRYHLHYFEWAWALAEAGEQGRRIFEGLWCDWLASNRLGRWDAWSPYVAAVRAWALCGLHRPLVRGQPHEDAYLRSIEVHAGYVGANLELDVGGNHLIKNIKALIGLGVFLDDEPLLAQGRRLLTRELPVQVLADGGHFERSPSYHAQALGDLADIEGLLRAAGLPPVEGLADAVERMRAWLAHLLLPDGTVPLLRDCVPVNSQRLDALGVKRLTTRDRCTVLEPSGYVVVSTGRLHAVLDVGQPCPEHLPAHAQADSLNWVLSVDATPVVVDTGTSSYQDPAVRRYERSTAAHNTVEIDGEDSTEVFGAFRAGRRAHVEVIEVADSGEEVTVTAEHDGYRHLPGALIHQRTWAVTDQQISVTDRIGGTGHHEVVSRLHLACGHIPDAITISQDPPGRTFHPSHAAGMGHRRPALGLASRQETSLPCEATASIVLR